MVDLSPDALAVIAGRHGDPFRYLGRHVEDGHPVVRALLPNASRVQVVDDGGHETELPRIHDVGLFAGPVPDGERPYRLRARYGENEAEFEDAYRFWPVLSDFDL